MGEAIREAETVGIPWTKPSKSNHERKLENQLTNIGPHAAAALRLLIFTGGRLREILDLRWEYVDLERGLLFLPDSKTGKKTIVLGAVIAAASSRSFSAISGAHCVSQSMKLRTVEELVKVIQSGL